ncbi:MAG: hypothetical protein P1U75_05145 [Antarcticimicrobium sp.]|nr:hypothetical protein [Antarcticimicrobium sp.]MDF1716043.1 hypothetical protein [Antarcticimicrobium sp.]
MEILFGIAGHVGIDIPLGVRHIRKDDRPCYLLVAPHDVLGRRPEAVAPVLLEVVLGRRGLRPSFGDLLEMLQPLSPQRLGRRGDDPVELAVAGICDSVENPFRQGGAVQGNGGR